MFLSFSLPSPLSLKYKFFKSLKNYFIKNNPLLSNETSGKKTSTIPLQMQPK